MEGQEEAGSENLIPVYSRVGENSYRFIEAVDQNPGQPPITTNTIQMWVAEQGFEVCPNIKKRLLEFIEKGSLGYPSFRYDPLFEAISGYYARTHGLQITRESLLLTLSTVNSVALCYEALVAPDEKILCFMPEYAPFHSIATTLGRAVVAHELLCVDRQFAIDFEKLEEQLADPKLRAILLCNPHNPSGRVWTREELRRVSELARKHGQTVISDEIFGELALDDPYTPILSLGEEVRETTVTLFSPTKTYNMSGLRVGFIVAHNADMMARLRKAQGRTVVVGPNIIAQVALQAAYECDNSAWLASLKSVIRANFEILCATLAQLRGFYAHRLGAGYLCHVDYAQSDIEIKDLFAVFAAQDIVIHQFETFYHPSRFTKEFRLSIAIPHSQMQTAMQRILEPLKQLQAKNAQQ